MRVALVSMPELSPFIVANSWHIPNLALCNVAGNTEGHEIRIFDLNRRRADVRQAVDKILDDFAPDVLGMSAMTFQYDTARAIAWRAKRRRPGIVTVLGGYHASMLYREIGSSWDAGIIDWVVRGEGDRAVADILEVLAGRRTPSSVPGVSWRDGDRYVHNEDRALQDLETLALPDRSTRAYTGAHLGFSPADVMETSRGCTLACNFCSINTMYGKSHRFFPIEYVLRDLEQMQQSRTVEIFCADDNITNDLDRLEDLLDAMIAQRKRIGDKFYLTTQATCAGLAQSQRLVDKMADAGIVKVFLGIENVSSKTLREIKKGDIVELTRTAVRRLREAGIVSIGGCINGFPHDDEVSIRENFEFFRTLGVDHTIDQLITPYPGTPARELALEGGYVTNEDDLSRYNGYWANVKTDFLSSEDLLYLRWRLVREVIGPFFASAVYHKHYPVYSVLWNKFFRPAYLFFDHAIKKLFGERWRFERMMEGYVRRDQFNLEAPPEPFRVKTLAIRERSFSMRGIQGWKSAEMSKNRHALQVVA